MEQSHTQTTKARDITPNFDSPNSTFFGCKIASIRSFSKTLFVRNRILVCLGFPIIFPN